MHLNLEGLLDRGFHKFYGISDLIEFGWDLKILVGILSIWWEFKKVILVELKNKITK